MVFFLSCFGIRFRSRLFRHLLLRFLLRRWVASAHFPTVSSGVPFQPEHITYLHFALSERRLFRSAIF